MVTPIASILPQAWTQFFDDNGVPAAGGSVFFYIPNTTTLKNVYQDPAGSVLQTNPVILDAGGRIVGVYGEGQYSMAVYDSLSNLIYTGLTQDILSLINLPATTRVRLSAPQSYFVSSTGSDSNSGTSGSPWLTQNHAVNFVLTNIDTNLFPVSIFSADSTYTTPIVLEGNFLGGGTVTLIGDLSAPGNCIISTTSANCITISQGAVLHVHGFKLQTTTSGDGIEVLEGGQVYIDGAMNYGTIVGHQLNAHDPGSFISISAPDTISGGAATHWNIAGGGKILAPNITTTLTGTPAFSTAFTQVSDGNLEAPGDTFTGSATGVRFIVEENGVIQPGTSSLTYFPGSVAGIQQSGGVYNNVSPSQGLQVVQGTFKNLIIGWASNTTVGVTADSVALTSTSATGVVVTSISLSLVSSASGVNGLDTGSLAASTWYYIFVIYNGTTTASLMSLSPTVPILPAGYTFFARVGALITDGSEDIIGFTQKGRTVQYTVGSNLGQLPQMITGTSGSITTPTWTPVAVGGFVPPTAAKIRVALWNNPGTSQGSMVAPNPSYGAYTSTTNPPPLMYILTGGGDIPVITLFADMVLESANIYYASGGGGLLQASGWEDNL